MSVNNSGIVFSSDLRMWLFLLRRSSNKIAFWDFKIVNRVDKCSSSDGNADNSTEIMHKEWWKCYGIREAINVLVVKKGSQHFHHLLDRSKTYKKTIS